ncbi:MAG: NDP-sugar synthase [Candidatus Thiodiazotropha sp. (ex Epidulcina cf. delphinae)]|nr:NDP-sugar synthase [Candidatus Thiodiazotropha sp. (ex Epidulcina cf. delphinae)]
MMSIHTTILAHRQGRELSPLTNGTCVAMLPVAGKPVIEYAIESLHKAGMRNAAISVNDVTCGLEELVGDGSRWGMELRYKMQSSNMQRIGATPNHEAPDSAETLLIHGDILLNLDIHEFLRQARATGRKRVYGLKEEQAVMMWEPGAAGHSAQLDFDAGIIAESACIELQAANVNMLNSFPEFHQANMDLISGRLVSLSPHGRTSVNGLIHNHGSKINAESLKSGFAYIGNNCNVHKTVQFDSGVIISDRVIIDRGAKLENSVVLSDTYIGEMVTIKNAIIYGNTLIRIDSGSVMQLEDELLFANIA